MADCHNLIHISSAAIACLSFNEPIPCGLPAAKFSSALYSVPSQCLEANTQLARGIGLNSSESLLDCGLSLLFPKQRGFPEMFREWHRRGLSGHGFEWEVVEHEGRKVTVQAVLYGHIVNEKLFRIWVILRDMSALPRAIRSVATTETHYRHLLNQPGIIFIRAHRDGTISFITPSTIRTIGVAVSQDDTPEDLVQRVCHPDDRSLVDTLRNHRNSLSSTPYSVIVRLQVDDDKLIPFELQQIPHTDPSGELDYFDLVGVQTLARGNHALSTEDISEEISPNVIAAGLAHDANNHLLVASANIQLANNLTSSDQPANSALRSALLAIQQCASINRRTMQLTGNIDTEPEPVVIDSLFQETISQCRAILPTGISLTASTSAPSIVAWMDPYHTRQILVNLIVNARDALGTTGSIVLSATIKAPKNTRRTSNRESHVCISVSDDGPGMPDTLLAKLFQPFVTTKSAGKGTGLGLTMVKTLVEKNSGKVAVTSALGVGTTFTLTLPASIEYPTPSSKKRSLEPLTSQLSVLVADDQPEVRYSLMVALLHRGHQVLAVPDGKSLSRVLNQRNLSFDVMIVDARMPDYSESELLKKARDLAPMVPIILTSGDPSTQHAISKISGPTTFLAKPFPLETLYAALESFGPTTSLKRVNE